MVLYERNGKFIGIGKEELLFLGYEDFEEFKSEHKDFADLFVNRPGYIFKFKNFSWIDYTLHSGAPKKSVILRLKNTQEVEVNIKISEIFLSNAINEQTIYYGIDLLNISLEHQTFLPKTSTQILSKEPIKEETTPPLESETQNSFSNETPFLVQDYQEEQEQAEEFSLHEAEEKDQKIKIDFDDSENLALEREEKPFIQDESSLKIETEDEILEPKLKIDLMQDGEQDSFEEENEDLVQEIPLLKKELFEEESNISLKIEPQPEEFEEFDLVLCAQEIGLDLTELATFLEEYLESIQENLEQIKEAISEKNQDKLKQLVLPLKGIAENLQMKHMAKSLEKIILAEDKGKEDAYEQFTHLAQKLKAELI